MIEEAPQWGYNSKKQVNIQNQHDTAKEQQIKIFISAFSNLLYNDR